MNSRLRRHSDEFLHSGKTKGGGIGLVIIFDWKFEPVKNKVTALKFNCHMFVVQKTDPGAGQQFFIIQIKRVAVRQGNRHRRGGIFIRRCIEKQKQADEDHGNPDHAYGEQDIPAPQETALRNVFLRFLL